MTTRKESRSSQCRTNQIVSVRRMFVRNPGYAELRSIRVKLGCGQTYQEKLITMMRFDRFTEKAQEAAMRA
ncbi:MAG TPA: hypothetical protein PL187_23825, partial [Caldilinea sp.]|nr:hypothetical protein [Caldilinea sp.]